MSLPEKQPFSDFPCFFFISLRKNYVRRKGRRIGKYLQNRLFYSQNIYVKCKQLKMTKKKPISFNLNYFLVLMEAP